MDLALRHQVGVRRFTAGEVRRITDLIDRSNADFINRLRGRLARLPANNPQSRGLINLMRSVRAQRAKMISTIQKDFTRSMREFSKLEAAFELDMIKEGLPVRLDLKSVAPQTLRTLVTSKPFSGGPGAARTMNQWFQGLKRSDQNGINDAIRLGVIQGETVDQMARRISGTRASGFTDGILGVSRRQSEAIVRTGTNHVSNAAREEAWNANADIMEALQWNGTLDGRTSPICRARDGKFAAIGDKGLPKDLAKNALNPGGARPPAHPNCRSIMTAVFSTDGISDQMGERPFVRDTRTRRMREKDFRAEAKVSAGPEKWKSFTPQERNGEIRRLRRSWTKKNVGTVPENTTYNQWLKKQPAKFQNEVLGVSKGKLFRTGQIQMDQFVNRAGAEFTLVQLASKRPAVFRRAGIDPVTLKKIAPVGPKKRVPKVVERTADTVLRDVRQKMDVSAREIDSIKDQMQVLDKGMQESKFGDGTGTFTSLWEEQKKLSTSLEAVRNRTFDDIMSITNVTPNEISVVGVTKKAKSVLKRRKGRWTDLAARMFDQSAFGGRLPEVVLFLEQGTSRAFWKKVGFAGRGEIHGKLGMNTRTFIHEFGHHVENANPKIRRMVTKFRNRRTRGEVAKQIPQHRKGEIAFFDKFFNKYAGRVYRDGDTEILSMGLEYMFTNPRKFLKDDPDYFDLILRIMSGFID